MAADIHNLAVTIHNLAVTIRKLVAAIRMMDPATAGVARAAPSRPVL